ncbi:hypothetical protein HZS_5056, partial [Henneguya salminicola]
LFLPLKNTRMLRIQKKTTPQKIIGEFRSTTSPNISAILPEYNTLQRNIQKIRQRENMPYAFPRSAADLIIPNIFKNTFRGEPFTVADILSEPGERTIIFAARRNLNYFSKNSSIYSMQHSKLFLKFFHNYLPSMRRILQLLFPAFMP